VLGLTPPSTAGTNVDVSVTPLGAGALQLAIPDGTTVGGNKRGANAVDLQLTRAAATQVASGSGATALGSRNTAGGINSTAIGYGNTTSILNAVAIGISNTVSGNSSAAIGAGNVASGGNSLALGSFGTTNGISGQLALGFCSTTLGKFQRTFTQLFVTTTGTTAKVATADGNSSATSNQLSLRANAAYLVSVRGVARDTINNTDAAAWSSTVLVIKGMTAASTTIIGAPAITSLFSTAGASGWTIALSADTTNGAVAASGTSTTTNAVDWNIQLDAIEVM
jgi:hypothetical protein